MPTYALKFISGKYQGGAFSLPENGDLIIGRAADADVVLVEDMVSRRHARLSCQDGTITLTDLGSTNGCFINGEKVQSTILQDNDRLLIGNSILRLTRVDDPSEETAVADAGAIRAMLADLGERNVVSSTSMSGDLAEVPLPDLLQLFASNKKNGTLSLTGAGHGTIYLKEGRLQTATLQHAPDLGPMKALCRMLSWQQGQFQFEATQLPPPVADAFEGSTEAQLMEALRRIDEAARLRAKLPDLGLTVSSSVPLPGRLADRSPPELDAFQAALTPETSLRQIVDHSALADHEIMGHLYRLLQDGFLQT